jgi:hypothetical protein
METNLMLVKIGTQIHDILDSYPRAQDAFLGCLLATCVNSTNALATSRTGGFHLMPSTYKKGE